MDEKVTPEELQRVINSFEESALMLQGRSLSAMQRTVLTDSVENGTALPKGWWA